MFNKNNFYVLILFVLGSNSVYPQRSQNDEYLLSKKWECGADEYHKKRLYEDGDYKKKTEEFEKEVYNILINSGYVFNKTSPKQNDILTIPVVVHIIHNNGDENITDSQVLTGIEHLNDAFRNRAPFDSTVGADTEIEFCLAKRDTNGNYTTGITRTQSTLTDFNRDTQDANLKALVVWDPTKYMNIWVVRSIASASFPNGVAGYANGPGGHGSPRDGIVIVKSFFGWIPSLSAVCAHEVGHYLGLAHTFSGGCANNNCLTYGDRICDTPPDKSTAPVSCNASINTCTTDEDDFSTNNPFRPVALGGLGDQDDMTINYMDYNYQCKKAFSQGQKDRMRISLTGPRNSLLNTDVCIDLCAATPIVTSFSASDSVVAITTMVSFTNLSSGSDTYQWTINGQTFSSDRDASFYFNTLGTYIIKLYTYIDGYPVECGMEDSIIVEVFCPSISSFTENKNQIPINDSVSFTNTSITIGRFQWFIRDSLVDTSFQMTYTFDKLGNYEVYLVAFTGACYDTSTTTLIEVYCPVTTEFTTPISTLVPGDSQTFINTSTGAISYEWFVDDTSMGTTVDLTYQFNKPGTNRIYLVSYNGVCFDTSNSSYIQVGNCNSQEATYWYFGDDAGIKFENDTVIPQKQSTMFSWEGTATMSDKNTGDLLFYTDGDTLFNANHLPMPNGTGLKGSFTSTQSALIIPMPGDGGKYYVFTVDASTDVPRFPNDSVCAYSIVDMTLDGGLGDIILSTKNTTLFTPTSEQIIGIRHCNARDYWVITHEFAPNPRFFIYLISDTGIAQPLIFDVGLDYYSSFGYMRASPDGSKIAAVSDVFNTVQIFNFDNTTGNIAFDFSIPLNQDPTTWVYGITFSPDGSKLYVSELLLGWIYYIFQYDMLAGDSLAIRSSRTVIAASGADYYDAMAIGPDHKIYIANWDLQYLHVINKPNEKGTACDFVLKQIDLGANSRSYSGLPNFAQDIFYDPNPIIKGPDNLCVKSLDIAYTVNINQCVNEGVEWNVYGNATVKSQTQDSIILDYDSAGTASIVVRLTSTCAIKFDTLEVTISDSEILDLGNDTSLCGDSTLYITPDSTFISYLWQDSSVSKVDTAKIAGIYWLQVTDSLGCVIRDSLTIFAKNPPPPSIDLGNDTTVCNGALVILDAGDGYSDYLWNDGSGDRYLTAQRPGTYWVTVTGYCGAQDKDTITVTTDTSRFFNLGNDTMICLGSNFLLEVDSVYASYIWSDGSANSYFNTLPPITVWVEITNSTGCSSSDTIKFASLDLTDSLNIGTDTTVCEDSQLKLVADTGYTYYEWQDGTNDTVLYITSSGLFWVTAKNQCYTVVDTVKVDFEDCNGNVSEFVPNVFTPNNDGINDVFTIRGMPDDCTLIVFNRWGQKIYYSTNYQGNWDGGILNPDVYYYILKCKEDNKRFHGFVRILK
ncbi:MAG: hypothetical protein COC01_00475 [Bacteroidetes bacterium]|nr:MAG: hypothetical protein COC01_00475 [Bacteroidota bacterium]